MTLFRTQMLRIRKFGEMPCDYDPSRGRKADAAEGRAILELSLFPSRLRHNGISPRLCNSRASLLGVDTNLGKNVLWRSRAERREIP